MGKIDVIHPLSGEFNPNLLWQAETCRYVSSASGDDANDGLTQYTPMQTIAAANSAGDYLDITLEVEAMG